MWQNFKTPEFIKKYSALLLFILFFFTPSIIFYFIIYILKLFQIKITIESDFNIFFIIYFEKIIFFLFLSLWIKKFYIQLSEHISFSDWHNSLPLGLLWAGLCYIIAVIPVNIIIYTSTYLNLPEQIQKLLFEGNVIVELFLEKGIFNNYFLTIFALILTCVLIPLQEEILFRGFLFKFFQDFFSNRMTIFITAIIFGLFHAPSIPNILFAFIIGIILGKLRITYQKLDVPILVHGFVNTISMILLIISNRLGLI